jgi:hypothetical protein
MGWVGHGTRILLALILAGAVLSVAPAGRDASAAPAPPSAYQDDRADRTRTIPAYRASTDPDRVVQVFSVKFWAREGERRYVTSQVIARQPRSTPDSLLMASVSVSCSPATGKVTSAGATENVLRGSSSSFSPRFVYVVPRTGMVGCVLVASGLRPRPVSSGRTSDNVWVVDAGSSLSVSEPIAGWARSVTSARRSRVLDRGEAWTPVRFRARVPGSRTFEVTSDHKVTTCSAVGGSRDSSTLGRELCDGRVSTQGTWVRLVVSAVQLDRHGDPCAAPQRFTEERKILADVHHAMVTSKVVVRVSRAGDCRPRFAIRGRLVQVGGADLVVHAPSERTSVLPG